MEHYKMSQTEELTDIEVGSYFAEHDPRANRLRGFWARLLTESERLITELKIPDENNPMLIAGWMSLLSLLLWLWTRRRTAKKGQSESGPRARLVGRDGSRARRDGSRPRLHSRDGSTTRPRLASHEKKKSVKSRDRIATEDMGAFADVYDDGFPQDDRDGDFLVMGPSVANIFYEAWSPPTSWTEASRQILPKAANQDIHREIQLDLEHLMLNLDAGRVTKKTRDEEESVLDHVVSIEDLSLHVKPPLDGGIIEIRVVHPNERWVEHTFASAQMAAQFQQDILGCQVVGEQVLNMFSALQLVQKGSPTTCEKEYVLHDTETLVTNEEEQNEDKKDVAIESIPAGVAWDDAMRCFSGVPSVRSNLETQLFMTTFSEYSEQDSSILEPLYENKRLILGLVDFFRLFVPPVAATALPNNEADPSRMEQLLTMRKRVARASLLVRQYVAAMTVVNQGWKLDREVPNADEYLKRRFAFDDDNQNVAHDTENRNEYYEPTVSRDVRCDVHSVHHLVKKGVCVPSPYQAYSLVGCHCFRLPPSGVEHPLLHNKNPVRALPSLRRIIEANPELDFFVSGFFPEGPRIAIILLFCRSLPKGFDKSFDTALDRFVNGSRAVRDRKMEVFIQLGPGSGLSPVAWASLKAFSALLSWTRRGEVDIPYESVGAHARTPFPGMTISKYMETSHFGGRLQRSSSLPTNYVAVNTYVDGSNMSNRAARMLYQGLEESALPSSIVDFSFTLEGGQLDELPERVMASIRMVLVDVKNIALPVVFSAENAELEDETTSAPAAELSAKEENAWKKWFLFRNSYTESVEDNETIIDQEEPREYVIPEHVDVSLIDKEYRVGVKSLWEVLRGVSVPVRKEGVSAQVATICTDIHIPFGSKSALPAGIHRHDLVNQPVLSQLSPKDLQRFFIASDADIKTAAVRVVNTAAWRGLAFPIDTRVCRIELQSGQFFQQGRDKDNCPVFYFQNMCLGPWRNDVDASISAIVYRLETCLKRETEANPDVRCTVVVLMGRPFHKPKEKKKEKDGDDEASDSQSNEEHKVDNFEKEEGEKSVGESTAWKPFAVGVNPRVDPEEEYFVHTNPSLASKLVQLLSQHYPERLARVLVVPGKGGSSYLSIALGGTLGLRAYIPSSRTRAKVKILNNTGDLIRYVSEDELASFVGGKATASPEAFECHT